MENEGTYLYQYTSIETLALILKSHCIKFNSLQNVDDLEEKESTGIKNFGKYAFVTCWTYDKEENIALWSMYTDKMKGVRIELPNNFLDDDFRYIDSQLKEYNLLSTPIDDNFIIKERKMHSKSYETVKVNYTKDRSKIYPNVWEPDNKEYPLVINRLGKNKSKQWEFQKELRYIIYTRLNNWLNEGEDIERGRERLEEHTKIPSELFVRISDEAYKNMKIMLGPNTNEADKIIVNSLVEKYNQNICLKISNLKIQKRS